MSISNLKERPSGDGVRIVARSGALLDPLHIRFRNDSPMPLFQGKQVAFSASMMARPGFSSLVQILPGITKTALLGYFQTQENASAPGSWDQSGPLP